MTELGVNKTTLQSVESLVEAKGTGIEELPEQAQKAITDSTKSILEVALQFFDALSQRGRT